MKRTVQMTKGNIPDLRKPAKNYGLLTVVGQNPRRPWTPGPVIDFHKSYSKRVAAARAEQARIDAKRADAGEVAA
jgi:hypothetical protein